MDMQPSPSRSLRATVGCCRVLEGHTRLAVHADFEAFRAAFFRELDSPRCPVTDEPLERVTSHVHHDGGLTAFQALVRAFVREQHVNLSRIESLAGRLLDDSLRGTFVAYHKERARLMVVSG